MKPVTPSLGTAIGALKIVADSSAELDVDQFREIAAGLEAVREQLWAVNERVSQSGAAPTPEDFAAVMALLAFGGRESPSPRAAPTERRYVVATRNGTLDRKQFEEDIHVSDGAQELSIQWLVSTGSPLLTIHGDSWGMLRDWPTLFASLAELRQDDDRPTVGEVEAMLIAHGFTERKLA